MKLDLLDLVIMIAGIYVDIRIGMYLFTLIGGEK